MSLSSSDTDDDFFDALESCRTLSRRSTLKPAVRVFSHESQSSTNRADSLSLDSPPACSDVESVAPASVSGPELHAHRARLELLRLRAVVDPDCQLPDEDGEEDGVEGGMDTTASSGERQRCSSPQLSLTGSVESGCRVSHPFRVVETDAQSVFSQLSLTGVARGAPAAASAASSVTAAGEEEGRYEADTASSSMPPPPVPTSRLRGRQVLSSAPDTVSTDRSSSAPDAPAPAVEASTSLQEPDIVSSAKVGSSSVSLRGAGSGPPVNSSDVFTMESVTSVPVAPPRCRRKRQQAAGGRSSSSSCAGASVNSQESAAVAPSVPSVSVMSASPVESRAVARRPPLGSGCIVGARPMIRSGTSSLPFDLRAVVRGPCMVRPLDSDSARAPIACRLGSDASDRLDVASVQSDSSSMADSICSGYSDLLRLNQLPRPRFSLYSRPQLNKSRAGSDRNMTADREILDSVSVLNLDTGERIPLSAAEERLPVCLNPLSLQIMRMTTAYVSDTELNRSCSSSAGTGPGTGGVTGAASGASPGVGVGSGGATALTADHHLLSASVADSLDSTSTRGRRRHRLRRFLGRTVHRVFDRAEDLAQKVAYMRQRDDEKQDGPESLSAVPDAHTVLRVPMKASSSHKGPYEFDQMLLVQDFRGEHTGPVWCMKFSSCGRLLASAGQDNVLRVWVLKSAFRYFSDMRVKYSKEKTSPTPSQESLVSQHSLDDALSACGVSSEARSEQEAYAPFMPLPLCRYTGHTADLLDVSWSKNYFILSSSMDKTVRLWHISRRECLVCFQHIEFVTAIAFHPKDDRFFLSGSLDGKLRMWNIPDKKVAMWNELDGQAKLITAANFCQSGRFAVVGTFDGRCVFYSTDQLKYHTQIHVRSSRARKSRGRKISGIEPMPGEDKVLVTCNDSRVRVYDLRDLSLTCKYKGFTNVSSQIKASISHDGKFIVAGSENQCVYIWKTRHDYSKFSSVRRDRNNFWEGIRAHDVQVTCALFSPQPDPVFQRVDAQLARLEPDPTSNSGAQWQAPGGAERDPPFKRDSLEKRHGGSGGTATAGYLLVTADFDGIIKVFLNRCRPKHSSLPAAALS